MQFKIYESICEIEMKLGKCPICKAELDEDNIDEVHFKGTVVRHTAYRCIHCDTIIGFSSHNRIS
jgi:hypothetical protein